MAKQFLLEITTPERLFMLEMVDMVILPAGDGENGIMAGHEKMVASVLSGIIRIQTNGEWRAAVCGEGYAMVYGDQVIVLVQSIEWPEEIDRDRAEAALARAETRIQNEETDRDRALTRMAKSRALARLKLLDDTEKKG